MTEPWHVQRQREYDNAIAAGAKNPADAALLREIAEVASYYFPNEGDAARLRALADVLERLDVGALVKMTEWWTDSDDKAMDEVVVHPDDQRALRQLADTLVALTRA